MARWPHPAPRDNFFWPAKLIPFDDEKMVENFETMNNVEKQYMKLRENAWKWMKIYENGAILVLEATL